MKGQMMRLASRGISLFLRVVGEGYPVLFMHGGPGADHSTLLAFSKLSDEFKLIFYDHRCNGRSLGANISTMTWDNLTADAESLRTTLGIDKWAIVGHSFGGTVALEYAVRYPNSLSHLCVLDSCGDWQVGIKNAPRILKEKGYGRATVEAAQRLFAGRITRNELLRTMMILGKAYYSNPSVGLVIKEAIHGMGIRRNSDACIFGFSQLMPGWSVMDRLNRIKVPTLIMAGRDDFLFPPEHQKLLSESITCAQLKIVEGAGHTIQVEKTEEVVAIIRQFLKK